MADQNYYWYEGKRISIAPSQQQRAVKFIESPTHEKRLNVSNAIGSAAPNSTGIDLGNGIILYDINTYAQPHSLRSAVADTNVVEVPVFNGQGREETLVGNTELLVKFKSRISKVRAQQILQPYGATIKESYDWSPNTYLCEVALGKNVVEVANDIYEKEKERVEYSQPNFIRLFKPSFVPNDNLFARQWALRNTGQTGGIVGQDISCVPAWDTTRGSTSIIVAIIDEGVDYAHEDLNLPGKLVTGYDALTRTNNCNPENNDAHGTACAGIVAAGGNNNLGISGVAPNCRILGVRIAKGVGGRWQTTDIQIADGINTAVARGADVLSNSWGGGSPSNVITNAIRNAKNNGRGGRGCIVCFAAGNDDGAVSYPGNLSEVITVAACNEYAERKSKTSRDGETWWGSNFGPEVDVCAPGVHIFSTDISGSRGYSGDNYIDRFNGTSAATPHVAGVAALVLSVNPNLTATEVETILRNSTDDLVTPGYDIYTGFGRINAKKAVDNAAGPAWGNPQLIPGWFGAEDQEGDIVLVDINGNGRLDLVVYHIDNPAGENHGYYRIGWDLNNQGIPAAWSPVKAIPGWFGAEDQGGGIAVADLNGNGRPDLVVFHLDNPAGENHGYYRIGWNLNNAGDVTGGWSNVKPIPGWFGAEDQGAGIAIADVNGNGIPDLIVYHIDNPGGENHGYYRIGWNLNSNGDVTGGWSPVFAIPGWFGSENQGGGIAVRDINNDGRPELIVFHIDNPAGENHGYIRIGYGMQTNGAISLWGPVRLVSGWFGAENQAGGIAVGDIDNNSRYDLVVYHIDNPAGENHGYYRVGWRIG